MLAVSLSVAAGAYAHPFQADTPKPRSISSASVQPTVRAKPDWNDLTPQQKQALQPLAESWISISEAQKKKWLAVTKNYPSMEADERLKMHSRMNEWVSLSPLQRAEARLNFATTKELSRQLTPAEKLEKWQAYRSLSDGEKQKLAAKSSAKPTGAALAVKPVAPQKLAPVEPRPAASSTLPPRAKLSQPVKTQAVQPQKAASAP